MNYLLFRTTTWSRSGDEQIKARLITPNKLNCKSTASATTSSGTSVIFIACYLTLPIHHQLPNLPEQADNRCHTPLLWSPSTASIGWDHCHSGSKEHTVVEHCRSQLVPDLARDALYRTAKLPSLLTSFTRDTQYVDTFECKQKL